MARTSVIIMTKSLRQRRRANSDACNAAGMIPARWKAYLEGLVQNESDHDQYRPGDQGQGRDDGNRLTDR